MRTLLTLTLLAAVVSFPVVAEADVYVVEASGLNVRKSASSRSRVLAVAKRGERLIGTRRTAGNNWVRVSYRGVSGYVYGRYIRHERPEDDASAFAQQARNSSRSGSGSAGLLQQAKVLAKSGLNIRSGPGSNHRKVGSSLPRGSSVTVLENQGNWSLVQAGGKTGWVYNKYLAKQESSSSRGFTAPASSRGGGTSLPGGFTPPSGGNPLTGGGGNVDTSQAPWLAIALGQRGVSEGTAAGRRKIREFHKTGVGVAYGHNTAWCASFMNWVMKKAGYRGTGSAMARSFERYGQRLSKPKKGAIVVFWRVSRSSGKGHVGIYMGESGGSIRVLGGNQSNAVNIKNYSKSRLLGYRWPTR